MMEGFRLPAPVPDSPHVIGAEWYESSKSAARFKAFRNYRANLSGPARRGTRHLEDLYQLQLVA
jgi:hypothetical protein